MNFKERQKVLELVSEVAIDDLSDSLLIDLLGGRIKDLQRELEAERAKNCHERLMLDSEWQRARQEREDLYRNPSKVCRERFYFLDAGVQFLVDFDLVNGPNLVKRLRNGARFMDYVLERVPADVWFAGDSA